MIWQLLWAGFAFFLGSLPFSIWVGRVGLKKDIREYGDSNPGATNVLRAGSFIGFTVAMVLDICKAAVPVGLAYQIWGWDGWPLFLIAMAPVLGHAFSPFLKFEGGKALAAMLGVWIGLSWWQVSAPALAFLIVFSLLLDNSGWAVILATLALMGLLLVLDFPLLFAVVALGQLILSLYKQRDDLRRRPGLRRWRKQAASP